MKLWLPLFLFLLIGCETTFESTDSDVEIDPEEQIFISESDLEPLNSFILETRRLIVADYIRIDMSVHYFEERIGLTRDFRYVTRKKATSRDGARVIILKNTNSDQVTNIDPALLPRVTFDDGLEVRAYDELRIYLRATKTRQKPVFLTITATSTRESKMWVYNRLEAERPRISLSASLNWNESKEKYSLQSSIR
ncbi:MAG: hypothetical protein V3T86_08920 [Planctomycetota bacterium]